MDWQKSRQGRETQRDENSCCKYDSDQFLPMLPLKHSTTAMSRLSSCRISSSFLFCFFAYMFFKFLVLFLPVPVFVAPLLFSCFLSVLVIA